MRITVHTERGVFVSKVFEKLDEDQRKEVESSLQLLVSGGGKYFSLLTEVGYTVIGEDLLKTAVFFVEL